MRVLEPAGTMPGAGRPRPDGAMVLPAGPFLRRVDDPSSDGSDGFVAPERIAAERHLRAEAARRLAARDASVLGLALATAAGTLFLDLALPAGAAAGIPYVITVLVSARLRSPAIVFVAAAGSTLLLTLGWLLTTTASPDWLDALNRSFALLAIWVTALMSRTQIRHQERLSALATRDPLTGLLNRRQLARELDQEIRRARRMGHALSVCMCDLDGFKAVNDRHGHQAGDRILTAFADLLASTVRETDTLGRYGGDEFMLLLPGASSKEAERVIERLRARVAAHLAAGGDCEEGDVTATFGLAELDRRTTSGSQLVRAADAALYRGKMAGRNRVEQG